MTLGFTRYKTKTYDATNSTAMLPPSHPDTSVRCAVDDDTPLISLLVTRSC